MKVPILPGASLKIMVGFFFPPLSFSHATHLTSQEILLTLLSKAT